MEESPASQSELSELRQQISKLKAKLFAATGKK
jgi:hypothetical protein